MNGRQGVKVKQVSRHTGHRGYLWATYCASTAIERLEGKEYYDKLHALMATISRETATPLDRVCMVFAVLSPGLTEAGNIRGAWWFASKGTRGDAMGYSQNQAKALAIINASSQVDAMSNVGGRKVSAFYRTLYTLDPRLVVVDGHIYNAWRGLRATLDQVPSIDEDTYDRISRDVTITAEFVGLFPYQMQAILWLAWKRIHDIAWTDKRYQGKFDWTTGLEG